VLRRQAIVAFVATGIMLGAMRAAVAQSCPNNVPHLTGTWTTLPYQMPLNPISATLLHTGRVLIIAGSENDANNNAAGAESYRAALWDPTGTGPSSISVMNLEYDVFCSGTAVLPHGRPLIIGGSADYSFKGENRASFFDPATGEMSQSQNMADGRWYATATVLGDGRIMAHSGLGSSGATNTKVEIYDLANAGAGWGTAITQALFTPPLFPREFLLPNGKVFFTGQGSGGATSKAYIFDPVAKTWTASVNTTSSRDYGSAVILPLLPPSYTPKVMNFGGGSLATRTTETIDLSAPSPHWTPGPDMSATRIQMNATLLPDGRVLAEGGSSANETPDAQGKIADLYDSNSGLMGPAGTEAYSRLYHSTAVLLPDATVASMGSNPGDRGSYQPTIEIYTPPYLYDANDRAVTNRPVITGVPSGPIGYGAPMTVTYTSASPISSAVLVRPGSATHANDMEQRMIGLCGPSPQPACGGSGTLTLTSPSSGNVAPPGYYMLFLLDSSGVPSKAQFVELNSHTSAPPTGTIATPASDATINVGGTESFTTTTTASKYSWVFPGGTPATSTLKNPGNVTFSTAGYYEASLTVIDAAGDSDPSPPTRGIIVLPSSADFEIDVTPSSRSVFPGGSATFTVTVTPLSGFTSSVSLAVSSEGGFPTGVTSGGFSPATIVGSGSSTLTMNTTSSTIPYALSLTITGTSGTKNHRASTTLLINLAPPAGLAATASNSQVALSWLPSVGASGYQVQRSLASGGGYQAIACPGATAYTDAGLTNGTTYYYVVAASFAGGPNSGGQSASSAEVAATPPCPVPAYSGSLAASRSGGSVTWSWTAGGAATYDVVRGDLTTLRSSGGDFAAAIAAIPAAEPACLANDTASLSLVDSNPDPPPGGGRFALIRAVATACPAHGTYDDGSATLVQSRDPGIAASPRSCP
jgi:hypothetical protein